MHTDGDDKREFLRVDYEKHLNFKVLKTGKLTTKTDIASRNISASGLLFRTLSRCSQASYGWRWMST
jgi:hypothetical protein